MTPEQAQEIINRNNTAYEMLDMVVEEILRAGVSKTETVMALVHVTSLLQHDIMTDWYERHDRIARSGIGKPTA